MDDYSTLMKFALLKEKLKLLRLSLRCRSTTFLFTGSAQVLGRQVMKVCGGTLAYNHARIGW
ncbi:hypothetical protein OK016_27085 [Vibrio chagasii]|nr:hypothetical protein [Vibrio chagasii]